MLFDLLKKLLYVAGILGLYHRIRNADTLTVVMFHRVLDPRDPRWASCDPDYTLSAALFGQCLKFFGEQYNIVSVEAVTKARRGESRLPPRALLITFDDGWADNVDFALPQLRAQGVPGLMFVVSDAVDRAEPFYQERIVGAWRRGRLTLAGLADALGRPPADTREYGRRDEASLRDLIKLIEELPHRDRARLLAELEPELADGLRHMVTTDELRLLDGGGVAIGLHGKTHTPLTRAADVDAELAGARREMAARMPYRAAPSTMSFPHGRYDESIAARAHGAGFELVFTSDPAINSTGKTVGWLLGRLGFESGAVADAKGRFHPEWLALYLFRKAHRAPA
jgi:peptidoglycan/xylan/chitin deacetylase (PgdA/CDA1 family)